MQTSSRTFYMADYNANPLPVGRELALYSFPDLEPLGTTSIVEWAVRHSSITGSPLLRLEELLDGAMPPNQL